MNRTSTELSGDPDRLQQVFWNLLSNAIKFTPKGGRVTVQLAQVQSDAEVSIIDSGEGIDAEFLPHVFDRFRQSDGTTKRKHGGLGLGLAIAKQLVELHGGSTRVKSEGAQQGATFTISLPLTEATDWANALPSPQGLPVEGPMGDTDLDLSGLTCLVVDDEPDARNLLRVLLERCNASVIVGANAAEGLELLKCERPDVLVSDIGMPGQDGYAFIKQVRRLNPEAGGTTPAVALTAYARAEDRVKAIQAGFQHHLTKPINPTKLIAMIASLAPKPAAAE